MKILDLDVSTKGKMIKIARMSNEWYDFVDDPSKFLSALKMGAERADLFTFLQEPDDLEKHHHWHAETDSVSMLPISTYEKWWNEQINGKTRNMIRKAEKSGLVLKEVELGDEFYNAIVDIYNESPSRQGKKFWHYGIDFEGAKAHIDTFTDRSRFVGVYDGDQMIGFFKLTRNANSASVMQIISKISLRNKAPNNALLAKAVEMCAEMGIPFLQYGIWSQGTLGDYKRKNGFIRHDVPRYYVPLSAVGHIATSLKLYRNPKDHIPAPIRKRLVSVRSALIAKTHRHANS